MIGHGKTRVWITFDDDVLSRSKDYAMGIRVTLSSMVNATMSTALGDQIPRPLRPRLPKKPEDKEEDREE